ncbi:MAG: prepilin-type N-terminal cleavage/methylation domain-containing protein [Magnetococcales bacterium]|nr:prepilin-type N-terminal cleavage/methylation domain-containing protein [Magnetococcales bacterium]
MWTQSQKNDHGFTLIEILVSFFIMTIAMIPLFQGFSTNLQNVEMTVNYREAVHIAESRLAVVGFEIPLVEGKYSGDVQQFQWHLRIAPRESEEPFSEKQSFALFQVDVTVQWIDPGQKEQSVSLTTVRLGKLS